MSEKVGFNDLFIYCMNVLFDLRMYDTISTFYNISEKCPILKFRNRYMNCCSDERFCSWATS